MVDHIDIGSSVVGAALLGLGSLPMELVIPAKWIAVT